MLAAAGARAQLDYRAADGSGTLLVLRDADREVLAAVAPAILAGTAATGKGVAAAIGSVDRAVAGLPPHLQEEVGELLGTPRFLAGPALGCRRRRAVAGSVGRARSRRSSNAGASAVGRCSSRATTRCTTSCSAAWYGEPDSWAAIGYPGPPEVG